MIIKSTNNSKIILDVFQSEEGGRFYKESNQNIIIEVGEHIFHKMY